MRSVVLWLPNVSNPDYRVASPMNAAGFRPDTSGTQQAADFARVAVRTEGWR
jgi:hypothetical protein